MGDGTCLQSRELTTKCAWAEFKIRENRVAADYSKQSLACDTSRVIEEKLFVRDHGRHSISFSRVKALSPNHLPPPFNPG